VPLHLLNPLHIGALTRIWLPALESFYYQLLEQIQRRAARWVCSSRWDPFVPTWTKSSDQLQCLDELGWPSLKSRRD